MFLKKIFLLSILFFVSSLQAKTGTLTLLVYENLLPASSKEVVINGKIKTATDRDGVISQSLKEGRHFVEMKINNEVKSTSFNIVKGEDTQIIVNLVGQDTDVEVSQPELKEKNVKQTVISGTVLDSSGKPVKEAFIYVSGAIKRAQTSGKGEFSLKAPIGKRIISIVHKSYKTKVLKDAVIKKGFRLKESLEPASLELDDFVVVAPHLQGSLSALIEVRKNSSNVAEVMGSEQIGKSGDSDAASSLSRVTGLTIVDGKYVYIRGLGERYSNVLLNDANMPSPDPTRRVVQLDLFPSGILDSMIIQKSYSPDLPGDFGGGTVTLKTKNIPEEFVGKVSVGTSYATGGNQKLRAKGGSKDWLGIDDGTRELPQSLKDATANGRKLVKDNGLNGGTSAQRMIELSTDMTRNYNVTNERASVPPSLSFALGDLYKHRGKKFGFLFSGMYSDKWDSSSTNKISYNGEEVAESEYNTTKSKRTIKLSGMLNLGVRLNKHFDIKTNTLLLRKTTDEVKVVDKSSATDSDSNYRENSIQWQERQLFGQVLSGEHQIGNNKKRKFDWKYSYSQAKRDQPDSRRYLQFLKEKGYETSTDGKNNEKLYNGLVDVTQDISTSFDLPLLKTKPVSLSSKFGFRYTQKERESETKRFKYSDLKADVAKSVTGNENIQLESLENICTDEVIRAGGCVIEDITAGSDRYSAKQSIRAYFLDTETGVYDFAKFNIGARFEESNQRITTFKSDAARTEINSGLMMQDILPVYRLTLSPIDSLKLRVAYSETVSRPDFKDLNPVAYFDDEKNRSIKGNLNLKGTIIENYDARLEWYFDKGENISLGVFRKNFINPIEEVAGSFDQNGKLVATENSYQLANVGVATSQGFEVEFRKKLNFINDSLENLSIGGNYSKIESELSIFNDLTTQLTNKSRPLQGQSPYVINANIDYDDKDSGTSATILYNVFGRRIDAVGTKPFDDVYEEPFKQVDFVFSQKFLKTSKVKVKFKNLLDPEALKTENGKLKETYRKGREASFSYTKTF